MDIQLKDVIQWQRNRAKEESNREELLKQPPPNLTKQK